MPYVPSFEERQRWRWFIPALDRWAIYERNRVLPPQLRAVVEPDNCRAWNYKRAAEAEAYEAEKARAELAAEIEEVRAYARRAFAELKAERAENRRLADIRLAHMRRLYAEWRKLAAKTGFNPDQPRVPAGNPDGGQWTSGEGGGGAAAAGDGRVRFAGADKPRLGPAAIAALAAQVAKRLIQAYRSDGRHYRWRQPLRLELEVADLYPGRSSRRRAHARRPDRKVSGSDEH